MINKGKPAPLLFLQNDEIRMIYIYHLKSNENAAVKYILGGFYIYTHIYIISELSRNLNIQTFLLWAKIISLQNDFD